MYLIGALKTAWQEGQQDARDEAESVDQSVNE
jgi:hypothetical protein